MKKYDELTYSDRFVFSKVNTLNEDICRETIELISGIRVEESARIEPESEIQITYRGKMTRLDIMLDSSDSRIDFDMENRKHEKSRMFPLRLRYYQDMIDLDMLHAGMEYTKLKKNIVIFLCTYDPFGRGYYRYVFKNVCVHDDKLELGDETIKIVLNAKGKVSAPGDEVRDSLINFLKYVSDGSVCDEFTRRLDMAVTNIVNNDDFRIEYMSAVAEYMEDEYEKAEYRKEIADLKEKNEALTKDIANMNNYITELEAKLAARK